MNEHWDDFFEENSGCFEIQKPEIFQPKIFTHTSTVWAKLEGAICQATNVDYLHNALENPNVVCVIADSSLRAMCEDSDKAIILTENSGDLFLKAHLYYANHLRVFKSNQKIAETATIHPSAVISDNATIGSNVTIGPNATLTGYVSIADGTIISANAVIGEEGLFAKRIDGQVQNIPHCGGVVIGKNRFIHSGSVIVRSAFAGLNTELGQSSHVGVMTNIGHDVTVGEETVISSNCVIAGRALIGNRCWIGASATISNGITVGDDADVKIGSVVVNDVPEKTIVSGNFAYPHKRHLKQHVRNQR